MQTQSDEIVLLTGMISITFLFLLAFLATILFLYQKRSLEYFNNLETAKSTYERSLLQSQIEIQEQTFQDISREIHDNIGLSLTLAKLQLNTLTTSQNFVNNSIQPTVDLISQAIDDLTHLSKSFNSDAIKTNGLYNTLKMEMEKIKRSGIQDVQLMVAGDIRFLDATKELIIYRIAQESLNNALRHANATQIKVDLSYGSNEITLKIVDNGKGFDICDIGSKNIPTGIQNMQKRAEILSGTFLIMSKIGHGTSISVIVPTREINEHTN
jgi:signal transduction histidine kinase